MVSSSSSPERSPERGSVIKEELHYESKYILCERDTTVSCVKPIGHLRAGGKNHKERDQSKEENQRNCCWKEIRELLFPVVVLSCGCMLHVTQLLVVFFSNVCG